MGFLTMDATSALAGSQNDGPATHRGRLARSGLVVPILTLLAYITVTVASTWGFTFSRFLYGDDNIYLARAVFGGALPEDYPTLKVIHILTDITGSVAFGKMLPIIAGGVTCMALIVLSRPAGMPETIAGPISLLLVSYPVDLNQGIFTLGNPAAFTAPVVVTAILVFWVGWLRGTPPSIGALFVSLVFFLLAGILNPACTLLIVVPVVWVFSTWLHGSLDARLGATASAVFGIFVLLAISFGITDYHYGGMIGWTEFTFSRIWTNLWNSLDMILRPFSDGLGSARWLLPAATLLMASAVLSHAVTLTQRKKTTDSPHSPAGDGTRVGALCVLLVAASALTLGPSTTVVSFVPRYVTLPFLLIASAGSIVTARFLRAASRRVRAVALFAVAIGLIGSLLQADALREERYGPHLDTHKAVVDLVERESANWATDAQVVLILPRNTAWPSTAGFNHWSTWYLRLLADREDVSGLIGRADWLNKQPFVANWQTSGWWAEVGGRMTRAKMKGLVPELPVYAYLYDGTDSWSPALRLGFTAEDRTLVLPPGTALLESGYAAPGAQCDVYSWPVNLENYGELLGPVSGVTVEVC